MPSETTQVLRDTSRALDAAQGVAQATLAFLDGLGELQTTQIERSRLLTDRYVRFSFQLTEWAKRQAGLGRMMQTDANELRRLGTEAADIGIAWLQQVEDQWTSMDGLTCAARDAIAEAKKKITAMGSPDG